jgi:hypothetical protein
VLVQCWQKIGGILVQQQPERRPYQAGPPLWLFVTVQGVYEHTDHCYGPRTILSCEHVGCAAWLRRAAHPTRMGSMRGESPSCFP